MIISAKETQVAFLDGSPESNVISVMQRPALSSPLRPVLCCPTCGGQSSVSLEVSLRQSSGKEQRKEIAVLELMTKAVRGL